MGNNMRFMVTSIHPRASAGEAAITAHNCSGGQPVFPRGNVLSDLASRVKSVLRACKT